MKSEVFFIHPKSDKSLSKKKLIKTAKTFPLKGKF